MEFSQEIEAELPAFVGSYNLDPRSAHLNTECGLIIEDAQWAETLKAEIQRDLQPETAWVIAPRHRADSLIVLQMLSREVTDWSPVDVSPFDAASAFELKKGFEPVAPDHPEFYQRYRDLGSFPGGKGLLEEREILGRLIKMSTPLFDPLL